MPLVDATHLLVAHLETDGGFETCGRRTPQAVRDLLFSPSKRHPHMIKEARSSLVEQYRETAQCCLAVERNGCEHVQLRVAEAILRSWYRQQESRRRDPADSAHGLLFGEAENIHPTEFNFAVQTRAVRTVLDVLAHEARDSSLNTRRSFNHTRGEGREVARKFEAWLFDKVMPSLGDEAVCRVNAALAAVFADSETTIVLEGLPTGTKDRDWRDTEIHLAYELPNGRGGRLSSPVNVKYVKSSTSHSNTGGTEALSWALLATHNPGTANQNELLNRIRTALTVAPGSTYVEPDSDYHFWSFERDCDDAPITDSHASSLLTVDPGLSCSVLQEAGLVLTPPFKVNTYQSFPGIQAHFEAAASSVAMPQSVLEGRDRLWNWVVDQHQPRAEAFLEALRTAR